MTDAADGDGDGPSTLRVLGLTKTFGDNIVLDGVSLSVNKERRFAFWAPADPGNRRCCGV